MHVVRFTQNERESGQDSASWKSGLWQVAGAVVGSLVMNSTRHLFWQLVWISRQRRDEKAGSPSEHWHTCELLELAFAQG